MKEESFKNLLIRACKSNNQYNRIKKLVAKYCLMNAEHVNDGDLFHFVLIIAIDCQIFASKDSIMKFFRDTNSFYFSEPSYISKNLLSLIGQISITEVSKLPDYYTKPKKFRKNNLTTTKL